MTVAEENARTVSRVGAGQLSRERSERANTTNALAGARHSKFGGVYQMRKSIAGSAASTSMFCRTTTTAGGNHLMMSTSLPQAPKKCSRRNSTCVQVQTSAASYSLC